MHTEELEINGRKELIVPWVISPWDNGLKQRDDVFSIQFPTVLYKHCLSVSFMDKFNLKISLSVSSAVLFVGQ